MEFKTFTETEALLLTAISISGKTIKQIAAATGIKPDTLYKWNSSDVHLSPQKADQLLIYFKENEPHCLEVAELLNAGVSHTND